MELGDKQGNQTLLSRRASGEKDGQIETEVEKEKTKNLERAQDVVERLILRQVFGLGLELVALQRLEEADANALDWDKVLQEEMG